MEITIRKLTPELAEDYVHFFDVTPHNSASDADKCYCVSWRDDASMEEDGHWFPSAEERRARALDFVRNGSIRGYLAYSGDEVVGWCNANEACLSGLAYLGNWWQIGPAEPGVRVKPIFCFAVKPEYRRQGIATRLAEAVAGDAAACGFDYVEAYVHETFEDPFRDFRGTPAMFEPLGFVRVSEKDGKVVMRKKLHGI